MSRRAWSVATIAVPAVLALLLFERGWLRGDVPVFRDLLVLVVPFRAWAAEAVRAGSLPLWIDELFLGAPFLAHYQSGVLYPPSLLMYALPFAAGLSLYFAFHLAIAGIGMARYLARRRSLDPAAALGGALVFAFGGFLPSLAPFANHLAVAAWLPWILERGEAATEERIGAAWLHLTGLLALQLLAGAPESVLLTWLLLGLVVARTAARGERAWAAIAGPLAALSLAIALSAVQLAPTIEYAAESDRGRPMDLERVTAESLEARSLKQLLLPHRFESEAPGFVPEGGIPLVWSLYFGVFPLILVAASAVRGDTRVWLGVIVFGLALAFRSPLFDLFYGLVPRLFGAFRYPTKFFLLAHFAVSVLVAEGLAGVTEEARARRIARLFALGLAGLGATLVIASRVAPRGTLAALGFDLRPDLADPVYAFIAASVGASATRLTLFALAALAIVALVDRRRLAGSGMTLATLAVIVADVVPLDREALVFLPWKELRSLSDPARLGITRGERVFHYCTEGLGCLPADAPGLGRWLPALRVAESVSDRARALGAAAIPNLPVIDGVGAVSGVDGFSTRSQTAMLDALARLPSERGIRLLAALGVRWLVGATPLSATGVRAAFQGAPAFVYEIGEAAPRAYLADRLRFADDETSALRQMAADDFRPGSDAVVRDVPFADPTAFGGGTILRSRFSPTRIHAQIRAPRRTLWVVNDAWYPGWNGQIDGRAAPIVRVNGIARGISVPPGEHDLEMIYEPTSLAIGAGVSAAALVVFAIGVAASLRRREGAHSASSV